MGSATRAADIMQTAVVTVSPDLSLADLQDLLLSHRIGGVPVVERGVVVGIVSRSDIVRTLSLERTLSGIIEDGIGPASFAPAEHGRPEPLPEPLREQLRARTVRDAMVADPLTVGPDTPVSEVARLLVDRHFHRVLVTEGDKLLGIISSLDLVKLLADSRI